jgi:8-oxo-dGTP pyrophosphatase MutT (NUDIX family)
MMAGAASRRTSRTPPKARVDSTVLYASPWVRVHKDRVRIGTGDIEEFLVVRRADFVVVVAELPDGGVVMVDQFRYGAQRWSLELPQGGLDPGETVQQAAVRELREETGWEAEDPVVLLERVYEAADWATQHFAVVRVRAVRRGANRLGTGEVGLTARVVEPREVAALVATGDICDAATLVGWSAQAPLAAADPQERP